MPELENKDSQESNNQKKQSLSETFNWFSKNKNFIQDVGDILSAQEKGQNELNNLKKEYENRLENTIYKKHFNSLIFIIDYINKEEGNVYVISTIKEFVESSINSKNKRSELQREVESNPKQRQVTKKTSDIGKISPEKQEKLVEKKDNAKILSNYKGQVISVLKNLEDIIANRDENTGFVNALIDDGVHLINNISGSTVETGKQIYQQSFDQVKSRIFQIEKEILKVDFNTLSPEEKLRYNEILVSIKEIKEMKIGDVGVLNSIIASIKSTPESLESAYYGAVGTGEGVIEGTKNMITGVFDITVFILKYSGSLVGIDSKYKTEVNNQASKIWDFMQKEGFSGLSDEVYNAIGKEMDNIAKLPKNEQAEAIGKLSGKVISLLLVIKGAVAASGKVGEMTGKIGRISRLLEKLSVKGASGSNRAMKLAEFFNTASKIKNISYAIEVFLNGPAETVIGIAGAKTFSALFMGLKTKGASTLEFKKLADEIVEFSKTPSKDLEPHFSNHPLKKWFEKEGISKSPEDVLKELDFWQKNIGNFPKEIHNKLAQDPEYLRYLIHLGEIKHKALGDIISALKNPDNEPWTIINFVKINEKNYRGLSIKNEPDINHSESGDDFDFGSGSDNEVLWDKPTKSAEQAGNNSSDIIDIDAVSEADVWLSYGRYDGAISFLESAIKREPDKLDYYKKLLEVYTKMNDTKKIEEISAIIKSKSSVGESVKIESKSANATIDSIDNINKNGALKLDELNLEVLEKFDSIPRIIEISEGKYVSVVKTSVTADGKSVFTVRYGIKNSTSKFPPFEGVSTFIVDKNKISIISPKTRLENNDYESIQKTLLDKIGGNKSIVDENPLEKVSSGNVGTKIEETKSIGDLEILKAGINNKGQDVFLVNVKDVNGKGLSQFEINVYQEGKDLVFYLGSMAKNSSTFNMNDLFKFIPKIADLTKGFSNIDLYKIEYLRIDGTGEVGKLKTIPIKPESLKDGFKI
ncbi:MAG: hypothetical protein PHV23_00200 [Candidatus Gracilibacteria bacterium]|nr:hypothetical protein [Candidatus Gracilibacteria bacterium]